MFLGQEVHYYMVYIAYFTELNLQICDYAQKRRICRKNCKYALDENFHDHFCPRRKAAKFCHPGFDSFFSLNFFTLERTFLIDSSLTPSFFSATIEEKRLMFCSAKAGFSFPPSSPPPSLACSRPREQSRRRSCSREGYRLTKVNFVHVYPQIPLLWSNIRLLV